MTQTKEMPQSLVGPRMNAPVFRGYLICATIQAACKWFGPEEDVRMRSFTKRVLLFVGVIVSILVRQQMSGAEAVTLQDTRWQPLPQTVRGVFVAPDGRIWYRDESPTERYPTVVDLKRMIAREFGQPTSRIDAIEPVLFEPSGRAWFSLRREDHPMLVCYDGNTWIDYAIADKMNSISGEYSTNGRLNEGRANRFAGGAAWFITGGGVLCFDGQHWSYQKMQDKTEFAPGSSNWWYHDKVWLAVSPDGKAAIACNSVNKFWIYREGQWIQRVIKERPEVDARRRVNEEPSALVLSGTETGWYQTRTGELRQICLAPEAKHEETSLRIPTGPAPYNNQTEE